MSLWVKICGNTSLEDAQLAVDSGADALGFVFAASPRRVNAEQVAAITAQLPASVEKIGVFVDTPFDEIVSIVRTCGLTGVQIHSALATDGPARLRAEFGPGLRILRVVHFGPGAMQYAEAYLADPNVDGLLVDSRTATAVGGTGIAFDWAHAAETLFQNPNGGKVLVAAGGLSPDNVAEAIATLRPWGVDVVSGVEAAPGRKDAGKVRAFIANARSAG
ncbi:phosphoribosylanthranilate isomerase [Occallatibacter riparius]|uniref:N-(5'-phosphoribosyl)anthranilate isomerase n=1 Tax=Occallatibacter riparius TaxID=1002689 RepID=A0A9J7BW79_9BACT|nr:phosphoribosylanthranilate isomerase [Occallatibacter riparius]UWZ86066.1 phosphoribosylanthranilate isomerase [Occallatibacter riparius]